MSKRILINGKEVTPSKKVKLDKQGVRPNDVVREYEKKKEKSNG